MNWRCAGRRLKYGSSRSSLSESDLGMRNPAIGGRLLVGTQYNIYTIIYVHHFRHNRASDNIFCDMV